jgi:hypothetical protein
LGVGTAGDGGAIAPVGAPVESPTCSTRRERKATETRSCDNPEVDMSKAILGSFADPRTLQLLDEIRSLRARVASLEASLEDAERAAQRHEIDEPVLVPAGPEAVSIDSDDVHVESFTV